MFLFCSDQSSAALKNKKNPRATSLGSAHKSRVARRRTSIILKVSDPRGPERYLALPPDRDSSEGPATPAARCGSGQWRGSEVLSVAPPGGSSEAVGSARLRIDWNNGRALVRVTYLLSAGPDLRLSCLPE